MIRQKRKTMGIFKHPKTGIYHANYFDDSGNRCRPSLHTRDKRIAQIKFAEIMQGKEANYFFDNSTNLGNNAIVGNNNSGNNCKGVSELAFQILQKDMELLKKEVELIKLKLELQIKKSK